MKRRITIDHRNTNKQLRHYDVDGDYMRLSVDETIARGLNQWSGWQCSAGVKNLYIDYDGNVWVCNTASANADHFHHENHIAYLESHPDQSYEELDPIFVKSERAWSAEVNGAGWLGSVFTDITLPKTWFRCAWQRCGCGADVFLPKAQEGHRSQLVDGLYGHEDSLVDEIAEAVAVEPHFPIPYQILWDLGRRCNYDCSYCWPAAHNRDAEHKPLDVLQRTAHRLINDWAFGQRIRWYFGGGEPTLHPQFLDFLRYLKQHDQWVLITTNGSRPRKYWKEAVELVNSVNLSVHFEFAQVPKLLDNIKEICDHFAVHDDDHWLEIKLMAPPGYVALAAGFREMVRRMTTLDAPGANRKIKGVVSIVPIRMGDNSLAAYTAEEIAVIQSQ